MKQKLQFALFCFAFVALSVWLSWPKSEPSWDGKTVSEWLVELAPESGIRGELSDAEFFKAHTELNERRNRAKAAIRHLGSRSLPHILRSLDEPSPRPKWLMWSAEKVGWKLPHSPSSGSRMARASLAFEALGADAKPVLPTLAGMLQDTNKVGDAAHYLASIGREGVPLLLAGLTSTNEVVREACFRNIGRVGTNASAAVPTVMAAVNDPNPKVARAAAFVYPGMEPDKEKLIATLIQWARSGTTQAHWALTGAKNVGYSRKPHGAEVQPLLAELLRLAKAPDDKLQASAISALGAFGELAADSRPLIVTALQSHDAGVRISACYALGALGQLPEASIPLLVKLAQEDPDKFGAAAIRAAAMFGQAGLEFCGPLRAQVEQAIQEREQHERLWQRTNPK